MTGEAKLEIIIDKSGDVQFMVKGVKGTSCTSLTEALEKALGEIIFREKTAEYYEITHVQNSTRFGPG